MTRKDAKNAKSFIEKTCNFFLANSASLRDIKKQ